MAETEMLVPREFQDGADWIVQLDEPDYVAAGGTIEEARLNFWKGLAMTFWARANHGFPIDGRRHTWSDDLLDEIRARFTSANQIPVERASIRAMEWSVLEPRISRGAAGSLNRGDK